MKGNKWPPPMISVSQLALLLCIFASSPLIALDSFNFKDYPVKNVFNGTPSKPILSTKKSRKFRTTIKRAARSGATFAGHFTIAEWGCGAPCVQFEIVDVGTGELFDSPISQLAHLSEGGKPLQEFEASLDKHIDDVFEFQLFRFEYSTESELLIIGGCYYLTASEESICGLSYFRWHGKRLRLLKHYNETEVQQLILNKNYTMPYRTDELCQSGVQVDIHGKPVRKKCPFNESKTK